MRVNVKKSWGKPGSFQEEITKENPEWLFNIGKVSYFGSIRKEKYKLRNLRIEWKKRNPLQPFPSKDYEKKTKEKMKEM